MSPISQLMPLIYTHITLDHGQEIINRLITNKLPSGDILIIWYWTGVSILEIFSQIFEWLEVVNLSIPYEIMLCVRGEYRYDLIWYDVHFYMCICLCSHLRFRSVSRCLRKSNRYIKKLKKRERERDDELMMKTSTKKQQRQYMHLNYWSRSLMMVLIKLVPIPYLSRDKTRHLKRKKHDTN